MCGQQEESENRGAQEWRDVKTQKKVPLRDMLEEEIGYFGIL